MKNILASILITFLCSCTNTFTKNNTAVFKYEEFGPPALANTIIGMDWWQWQSHGDSRPRKYDIKIVVYKNIDLITVKNKYPVSPKDLQDFRYLEYKQALIYLDNAINENVLRELTQKLINTKKKLQSSFENT